MTVNEFQLNEKGPIILRNPTRYLVVLLATLYFSIGAPSIADEGAVDRISINPNHNAEQHLRDIADCLGQTANKTLGELDNCLHGKGYTSIRLPSYLAGIPSLANAESTRKQAITALHSLVSSQERRAWITAERSNYSAGYARFLAAHPHGVFSTEAYARLGTARAEHIATIPAVSPRKGSGDDNPAPDRKTASETAGDVAINNDANSIGDNPQQDNSETNTRTSVFFPSSDGYSGPAKIVFHGREGSAPSTICKRGERFEIEFDLTGGSGSFSGKDSHDALVYGAVERAIVGYKLNLRIQTAKTDYHRKFSFKLNGDRLTTRYSLTSVGYDYTCKGTAYVQVAG